ncbi:hypothetical protein BDW71DRAFT_209522 [Aspergillus fruticulosus]
MTSSSSKFSDIYIGFGAVIDPRQQHHWTLILAPQTAYPNPYGSSCTFYHVSGGPTSYKHCIEHSKALNDPRISFIDKIGIVLASAAKTVHTIAETTYAQRCQRYIVSVLAQLERHGLLESYCAAYYAQQVETSLFIRATRMSGMEEHVAAAEVVSAAWLAEILELGSLEHCSRFF